MRIVKIFCFFLLNTFRQTGVPCAVQTLWIIHVGNAHCQNGTILKIWLSLKNPPNLGKIVCLCFFFFKYSTDLSNIDIMHTFQYISCTMCTPQVSVLSKVTSNWPHPCNNCSLLNITELDPIMTSWESNENNPLPCIKLIDEEIRKM